jgi:predicted dehydrogenase
MHVMCEKPMALQSNQAWELVNLAKEADRQLLVPYGWHYKDHVQAARKLLADVGVGEIESVVSIMASPTKAFFAGGGDGPSVPADFEPTLVDPDPATWQTPERGGGYLHGQLTHSTAMLFWLTGLRANEVSCLMTKPASAVDMYDAATVRFDGGALGTISGNATLPDGDPFHMVLQLFGSEGVLLLDLSEDEVSLRRHDGRHERIACAPDSGHYSCEGPPNRFVDLILGDGENESPGQAAALSVELLAAMTASAEADGVMIAVH